MDAEWQKWRDPINAPRDGSLIEGEFSHGVVALVRFGLRNWCGAFNYWLNENGCESYPTVNLVRWRPICHGTRPFASRAPVQSPELLEDWLAYKNRPITLPGAKEFSHQVAFSFGFNAAKARYAAQHEFSHIIFNFNRDVVAGQVLAREGCEVVVRTEDGKIYSGSPLTPEEARQAWARLVETRCEREGDFPELPTAETWKPAPLERTK